MAEMLVALPFLCLFVAGIVQFAVIFLCDVRFEHACGEASRQYAAGIIQRDSMAPVIRENLGSFQRHFDLDSLTVSIQEPSSTAGEKLDEVRSKLSYIPFTLNYDGYEWSVGIRVHPPAFFRLIFPQGLPLHTVMQVFRYPR